MPSISQTLESKLAELAPGHPLFLGEIVLIPGPDGTEARHAADLAAAAGTLRLLPDLAAVREIAKTDADGNYRPLRVAPGLRRGWRTPPRGTPALVETLHALYPSALAFWARPEAGEPVPFSATARRQTGMYRLVQTCGDDGEALRAAVAAACDAGCLRRRLWGPGARGRDAIAAATAPDAIPLLCPEACNYLVAKVRDVLVAARDRGAE